MAKAARNLDLPNHGKMRKGAMHGRTGQRDAAMIAPLKADAHHADHAP